MYITSYSYTIINDENISNHLKNMAFSPIIALHLYIYKIIKCMEIKILRCFSQICIILKKN
jgi:hypothetical protein